MKISGKKREEVRCRFIRIGGSYQPIVKSSADFPLLLELDDAHWEVTSLTSSSLRTDKRLLDFIDSDKNKLIRTDEVREAVRFLLKVFTDLSDTDKALDVIDLNKLNAEDPDGREVLAAARTMLHALGKTDADSITLDEISNDADVRKCTMHNGDGVIVADVDDNSDVAQLIRLIEKTVGAVSDLSGTNGVNLEKLEAYVKLAQEYKAWLEDGKLRKAELEPFGANSKDASDLFKELKDPIEHFYLSSSALAFFENDPERIAKRDMVADLRSAEDVGKLLTGTPIAAPEKDGLLRINGMVNPRWKDVFGKFDSGNCRIYRKRYTLLFRMERDLFIVCSEDSLFYRRPRLR